MNEQWQRLQRNVGNIFMGIVGKVLPYLNAVLMVLNEIAKIIARLFGYKLDDFDYFDESTIGGVEDFGDALDSAAESAEKLKHGLRGFDKLNVVTSPTTSGSTGGVGGAGGINPKLMSAFNDAFDLYQKKLADVEMKATKIRDKIMEWLGFTKVIDEDTGEVSFKFDHITGGTVLGALAVGGSIFNGIRIILKTLKRLGLIKFTGIKDIAKLFTGGKLTGGVAKLTTSFEGLASALGISTGALALAVTAIVAIGAALVYAYNKNEDFRKKVDEMVKSLLTMYATIYDKIIKPITEALLKILAPAFEQAWENIKLVLGLAYDGIVGSFSAISDTISGAAKIITDIVNLDFGKAFKDLKELVGNLKEDWNTYWGNISERIETWKNDVVKKFEVFVKDTKEKLEKLPEWFEKLPERLGKKIGRAIRTIKDKIDEVNWEELGKKMGDGIYNGFVKELPKLSLELNTLPIKLLAKVGELWWQWMNIGAQILAGIVAGMAGFIKNGGLGDVVNSFVKGLKKGLGINSPARVIIDAKIGDYSMEGILVGMERQLPKLQEEAKNIVDTLNSGIKEASIDTNFNYNIPQFDASSMILNSQGISSTSGNNTKQSINPTIIVQVGDKELARKVITDLQDMAIDNGKPITIGG